MRIALFFGIGILWYSVAYAGDHVMDNLNDGLLTGVVPSARRRSPSDPEEALLMRLDPSILFNGRYRDPNWRPDPALIVGDSVPHSINGRLYYFVVIRVFWDGRVWRYVTVPDTNMRL